MRATLAREDETGALMSDVHTFSSDVAFTPAVKAVQARKGSREAYARVEQNGRLAPRSTRTSRGFLAETDSFFLAIASADGQPTSSTAAARRASSKPWTEHDRVRRLQRQPAIHHASRNLSENPRRISS
jgi:hypothetical protein